MSIPNHKETTALMHSMSTSGHEEDPLCRATRRLRGICGRRAFGKYIFEVITDWPVAGICSAFGCGFTVPLAIMLSAR